MCRAPALSVQVHGKHSRLRCSRFRNITPQTCRTVHDRKQQKIIGQQKRLGLRSAPIAGLRLLTWLPASSEQAHGGDCDNDVGRTERGNMWENAGASVASLAVVVRLRMLSSSPVSAFPPPRFIRSSALRAVEEAVMAAAVTLLMQPRVHYFEWQACI